MEPIYKRIFDRAELVPRKGQETPAPRRYFRAKKITYRYPVGEGIEGMLRARLGPDAVDRYSAGDSRHYFSWLMPGHIQSKGANL